MDEAACVEEMSTGNGPPGPKLRPLDHHILDMLSDHQWTTGAIIDEANERARSGDLSLDDYDPDDPDADDEPVKRHQVYQRMQILEGMGFIERVHDPTSLYGLVYDPRE